MECIVTSALSPARHFLVREGGVVAVDVACDAFSCDGDSFYGVTRDGDLTLVNVDSGRIARTRWGESLVAVAAARERFAVANMRGDVYFL
jgi:hypothetical protein